MAWNECLPSVQTLINHFMLNPRITYKDVYCLTKTKYKVYIDADYEVAYCSVYFEYYGREETLMDYSSYYENFSKHIQLYDLIGGRAASFDFAGLDYNLCLKNRYLTAMRHSPQKGWLGDMQGDGKKCKVDADFIDQEELPWSFNQNPRYDLDDFSSVEVVYKETFYQVSLMECDDGALLVDDAPMNYKTAKDSNIKGDVAYLF